MENIVSARRLRKSVLKDIDAKSINVNREIGVDLEKYLNKNNSNNDGHINSYNYDFNSVEKEESGKSFKLKFKTTFLIKVFLSIFIVFACLICKMFFSEEVINKKAALIVIDEYKKDYSKEYILNNIEEMSKKIYNGLKYIIPESLANKISNKYVSSIKPNIIEFELQAFIASILSNDNSSVTVEKNTNLKEEDIVNDNNVENEEYDGKGGGEPLELTKIIEESSAVSIMQDDIGKIVSKGINMISPLNGTITSNYGARDQIFDGVTAYHTGIDIATKKGVEIKSSTDGKVVKVQENDKYYGNNVLIETNGVTFKYAHMDSIKVKLNDEIKQGDIVGYVGSTGMSTGPHLHFEISIDSRTVDPAKLINF